MTTKKIFSFAAFTFGGLLTLAGCHSNPYPQQGQLLSDKPNKQAALPYSVEAPDVVEFQEGTQASFSVVGHVPSGQALIDFSGLPTGAQYDPATAQITWQPDFNAANDPNDPTVITRIYPVVVSLKDANDPVSVGQKTITLVVHDVPQGFVLANMQATTELIEGQPYNLDIQIKNGDFPQGPFGFEAKGLPPQAQITQDQRDPTLIHLKFFPDHGFVKAASGTSININWDLQVFDPRGHKIDTPVQWTVDSNRKNPEFYFPQVINDGPPTATFMVNVFDPNGETIPTVTVNPPDFGQVTLTEAGSSQGSTTSKPFHLMTVRWTGIPVTQAGQKSTLTFNACVLDASDNMSQCGSYPVSVYFNGGKP